MRAPSSSSSNAPPPASDPPSSSSVVKPDKADPMEDLVVHRLVLASLALSAMAICASTLMLPVLIDELDDLSAMASRESKEFKDLADEIWRQMMRLQGHTGAWHLRKHHYGTSSSSHRGKRELQMLPGESRVFLERLERKSYKGRQRIKQGLLADDVVLNYQPPQQKFPFWELYTKAFRWPTTTTVPQATALYSSNGTTAKAAAPTTAAQARGVSLYGEAGPSSSSINRGTTLSTSSTTTATNGVQNQKLVFPTHCPRGQPGYAGKPGYDGVPGIPGVPGKKGLTGDEVQQSYESRGPRCVVCPAGPPGLPGATGFSGANGEPGISGVPGTAKTAPIGPPGPTGDAGAPGTNGTNGIAGLPGSPGIKYIKGPPGPKGELGPTGDAGVPGSNGQDGQPGSPGEPGYQGWQGGTGQAGKPGDVGSIGEQGIPGAERHYCNCPVRTSQLMRLRDHPEGFEAYLGRWKGRVPNQLLSEYEKYTKEKDDPQKEEKPVTLEDEVQLNRTSSEH